MRHQSKYEVQSGESRYGDESLEDVQDGCLRFVATEQILNVNSLVIQFVALYIKFLKLCPEFNACIPCNNKIVYISYQLTSQLSNQLEDILNIHKILLHGKNIYTKLNMYMPKMQERLTLIKSQRKNCLRQMQPFCLIKCVKTIN